ncbi:MAG: FAD:protein FMN transferase [Elusimicrobiota bacterium]|nr:FAD:protein FMN transferase [Elusimicrobiota bacterium]
MSCTYRAGILFMLMTGLAACSPGKLKKFQDERALMGTKVSITVFSEDGEKAARAMEAAFSRISALEAILSKQRKGSDIDRLNSSPDGKTKVAPETFEVIKRAVDYGKITLGAFDVTVEPLLKLWERAEKENLLPTPAALKRALDMAGYDHISLDPVTLEVKFDKPGMRIDIGGIAKGYIVGEAVKAIQAQGVTQALVTAGGDMYALGANPERGAWNIGIRNPLKQEENIRFIEVSDRAVSTSGHYMRFYTVKGKQYSHIVDPRTGYPAKNNVVSVTVIGADGTAVDALTKSMVVLGAEKGLAVVAAQPGFDALVLTWDGAKLEYFQTPGFAQYLR